MSMVYEVHPEDWDNQSHVVALSCTGSCVRTKGDRACTNWCEVTGKFDFLIRIKLVACALSAQDEAA